MEALAYALEHHGAEMYIFRETYDDLEANIIREWKEKVPKELYTYHESKHAATLINGSVVKFRYIRNFEDAEGYQGRSMDWIGVDELTKHEKRSIQVLLSCLRSPKGFKPRFRGTCNPGGKGHSWVKSDYIEATNYGAHIAQDPVTENTVEFIPAKVYDNTTLMLNDPNYVKRLENLPEAEKKAFLHGDWDIFEGMFFGKFKREIHVEEPREIPDYWQRFRCMDYGLDMCAVYWCAVDTAGVVHVYKELYESNLTLSDAAKRVISMTNALEEDEIRYTVASPDLWNRRQDSGISGMEIMQQAGLRGLIKADAARVPGWRNMREYIEPFDGIDNKPDSLLKISTACPNLIRCIPQLQHDDKDPEDASGTPHEISHGPESLRYGLMSRPKRAKTPIQDLPPLLAHKQRLIKRNASPRGVLR